MTQPDRVPGPESFGPEYFSEVYGHQSLSWHQMGWWSVRFYAKIADRLLRRMQRDRYLEIGCGYGYIIEWLDAKYRCTGVDISEHAIEQARTKAPNAQLLAAAMGGELPSELADQRFDLILARYVFEHLPEPGPVVQQCAELLSDGGMLLFSVPNTESPGHRIKGDDWFGYGDETHVSLLSPHEWIHMTKQAGLTIESQFSDGMWDIPYWKSIPGFLQYPIFCLPAVVSVFFARPMLPLAWGENLIVIAKKPACDTGESR